MKRTLSPFSRRRRAPQKRLITLSICVFATLMGALIGCSKDCGQNALSVFFEGVPATTGQGNIRSANSAISANASIHKPFQLHDCAACHRPAGSSATWETNALRKGMCIECHADVQRQYAFMHQPMKTDGCLWCHEPHESASRSLLRSGKSDLCVQCHEQSLLSSKTVQHNEAKSECLACHAGHGGSDHNMLRAELNAPATRPSAVVGGAH